MEQHYKEPVNGQFEDCTNEMLPGVETESSSDVSPVSVRLAHRADIGFLTAVRVLRPIGQGWYLDG